MFVLVPFQQNIGEEVRTFGRVQAGEKDISQGTEAFGGTLQARQDICTIPQSFDPEG